MTPRTCLVLVAGLLIAHFASADVATGEDKVDGAYWKYEMSQIGSKETTRQGRIRIEGTAIYQPRERKSTQIGTIEGKKGRPKAGDKVQVTFESLRAADGTMLKCSGPVTWESFGEVNGRLIDENGKHWQFKASRTQE
jgi:uncharacterized glyoxalase superfamily protein PhnB